MIKNIYIILIVCLVIITASVPYAQPKNYSQITVNDIIQTMKQNEERIHTVQAKFTVVFLPEGCDTDTGEFIWMMKGRKQHLEGGLYYGIKKAVVTYDGETRRVLDRQKNIVSQTKTPGGISFPTPMQLGFYFELLPVSPSISEFLRTGSPKLLPGMQKKNGHKCYVIKAKKRLPMYIGPKWEIGPEKESWEVEVWVDPTIGFSPIWLCLTNNKDGADAAWEVHKRIEWKNFGKGVWFPVKGEVDEEEGFELTVKDIIINEDISDRFFSDPRITILDTK